MNGWYWEYTSWFWQTNWLIFEIWLLVFLLVLMAVVSCFTPKPTAEQDRSHNLHRQLQKTNQRKLE